MRELSLHILDIAENSIAANAKDIEISIFEDTINDTIKIKIQDNGKGIDKEMLEIISDPFTTSRTTRKVGLGIPLLKAAAEEVNGSFKIDSLRNHGTALEVSLQRSHIDRMPLGDLPGTFLTLLVSNPDIHWIFMYMIDNENFLFDSAPIKKVLGDVSFTEPQILAHIREHIEQGIYQLNVKDN